MTLAGTPALAFGMQLSAHVAFDDSDWLHCVLSGRLPRLAAQALDGLVETCGGGGQRGRNKASGGGGGGRDGLREVDGAGPCVVIVSPAARHDI